MSRPSKGLSIKALRIWSVPDNNLKSMHVNIKIIDGKKIIETKALIDSGAQGIFMDKWFAKKHQLLLLRLNKEIQVSNVDESPNKNGPIRFHTWLPTKIDGKTISTWFLISNLGKEDVFIELPWLDKINPKVDLTNNSIKIVSNRIKKPTTQQAINKEIQIQKVELEKKMKSKEVFANQLWNIPERKKTSIKEISDKEAIFINITKLPNEYEDMPPLVPDTEDDEEESEGDLVTAYLQGETISPEPEKEEPLNQPIQIDSDIAIRAKTSISQSLAHKEEPETEKTFEELVPKEYHHFRWVFEKKASERFPESRSWDHRIDLKSEFILKRSKLYPLGQKEEEEMNKFIDDNLKKGFIWSSNSPQASPFFFIAKKDSKALRPCQDYRYLNKYTIKNTYPLPSIDDLQNKLLGATIFTKLDIRWGYNNVQIKQGDEWKGAFITKRGLFEQQ